MQTEKQIPTRPERKSKQFWAITDFHEVQLVTGYECPPNDDVWWVPELGYSLTAKHHLFSTARAARHKAIQKLQSNISDLQRALTRLEAEQRKDSTPSPA